MKKNCKTCGVEFEIIKSRKKTAKFCSHKCYRPTKKAVKQMARSLKGKLKPKKWREERSKATLAEKNPNWKGDEVGKYALHLWVKARLPRTKMCEFCGLVPPKDLANISQKYLRKLTDWEWLCRKCHMKKDGRYKNLKQFKV